MMKILLTLGCVLGMMGCLDRPSEPSDENAAKALEVLLRSPASYAKEREACKLLLKSATPIMSAFIASELVDAWMRKGTAPARFSEGLTPSDYKHSSQAVRMRIRDKGFEAGKSIHKSCKTMKSFYA